MNINVNLSVHELVDALTTSNSQSDVMQFIVKVDDRIGDYDFTYALMRHAVKILSKEFDAANPSELDLKIVEFNTFLESCKEVIDMNSEQ